MQPKDRDDRLSKMEKRAQHSVASGQAASDHSARTSKSNDLDPPGFDRKGEIRTWIDAGGLEEEFLAGVDAEKKNKSITVNPYERNSDRFIAFRYGYYNDKNPPVSETPVVF